MKSRMAICFYDTLTVLDILSKAKEGLTVGGIQKHMSILTVGQVKRITESLLECGFIHEEIKPHGATGKKVYHMTENAAIMLSSVGRQYVENLS